MSARLSRKLASALNGGLLRSQVLLSLDGCYTTNRFGLLLSSSQPVRCIWRYASATQSHTTSQLSPSARRQTGSKSTTHRTDISFGALHQRTFFTSAVDSSAQFDSVIVQFDGEFIAIELRIPGTSEHRRFVFRRHVDRLSNLYAAIQAECRDRARQVHVLTPDGARLASSTLLGVAFGTHNETLRVVLSGSGSEEQLGEVQVVLDASAGGVATERLEQLRTVVDSLYEQLNVAAFRRSRRDAYERELTELRTELAPLETLRGELEAKARRSGKRFAWIGMAYMGVQTGILARLTWWDYSWDIVEPISYFVTYSTSMVFFAYYLLTRQEWTFPDVEDRRITFKLHNLAARNNFDTKRYNALKQRIAYIEAQLRAEKARYPLIDS